MDSPIAILGLRIAFFDSDIPNSGLENADLELGIANLSFYFANLGSGVNRDAGRADVHMESRFCSGFAIGATMADFIPRQEDTLMAWMRNFTRRIVADPVSFGVFPSQLGDLEPLTDAYLQAARIAMTPTTRTKIAISEREEAKAAMLVVVRRLVAIVRRAPGVPASKQVQLGLKEIASKTRIGTPETTPSVFAKLVNNRTLRVRLSDADSVRYAKPAGVSAAAIFVHLGDQAPANINDWTWHSNQTRADFLLTINGPVEYGQQVWICACWLSTRGQRGAFSAPTEARIIGGIDHTAQLMAA